MLALIPRWTRMIEFIGRYYDRRFVLARKETAEQGPTSPRPAALSSPSTLIVCRDDFCNVDQVVIGIGRWIEPARVIDQGSVRLNRKPRFGLCDTHYVACRKTGNEDHPAIVVLGQTFSFQKNYRAQFPIPRVDTS